MMPDLSIRFEGTLAVAGSRLIGLAVVLAVSLTIAPLVGEAQQGKAYRIGFLSTSTLPYVEAFRQGLRDLGYVEGLTIVIEYRSADGDYRRLPSLAKELVGLNVDLIVTAGGTNAARAAKEAKKTIPVVVIASDLVANGLVSSLSRPGGNLTGLDVFTLELDPKRLELLKEALPKISRVTFLTNPESSYHPGTPRGAAGRKRMEAAAQALGVRLRQLEARVPGEIDTAFSAMARERPDALMIMGDTMLNNERRKIVDLAAQTRIPVIYPWREAVQVGGLMFYGTSSPDIYRRAATYVDKILKGARPADLPVEQPTKFELVINLKTAKALGLTLPQTVLLRADQIIE